MSYFEGQGPRWAQHGRQQSWDTAQPGPRPEQPAPTPTEHQNAFSTQFEEVQKASENLAKSSRSFGGHQHGRRGSVPVPGSFTRQYAEFGQHPSSASHPRPQPNSHSTDPRLGGPARHFSVGGGSGDFEGRSHSSHGSGSLQGYLANQRFGGPRGGNDADQMMQAKRRAAAQRERELRNYHQEQQYNKSRSPVTEAPINRPNTDATRRKDLSGPKSDRSMSPSAMSEEDRRELIARQHRALYGNESNLYVGEGGSPRPINPETRALAGQSGHASSSPMPYDSYGPASGQTPESGASHQRSRSNSNASPAATQGQFGVLEGNHPSAQPTSTSSPAGGESPTRVGSKGPGPSGVAPIGTRPSQAKRSTPPQPSPLGFGYNNEKGANANERSQSAASNPATSSGERPSGLGWGSGTSQAPWGSNKVQASVWG